MTKREIRNPIFCGRSKSYSTILMKCIGFQNFLFCSFDVWWSTKLLTVFFLQFCIFVYLGRTHFSSRLTVYKTITSKGWLWNLVHPMESHLHIWYSTCTKRIFSLLHGHQMDEFPYVTVSSWWFFLAPAAWEVGRRTRGNWIPCGLHNWYKLN